jgi:hypothetical protein
LALFGALVDDFAAASLDASRWEASTAAAVVSGTLRLTPSGTSYTAFRSKPAYGIAGSAVFAKVTPLPATGTSAVTELRVGPPVSFGDDIGFAIDTVLGTLRCEIRQAPGAVVSATSALAYSPVAHAWLQIRVTAAAVIWEASPTGRAGTWTVLRSSTAVPGWAAVENQELRLSVQRAGGTAGGYAVLDAVNTLSVSSGGVPISDTFEAPAVSATWSASTGTPTQIGGRMILEADDALVSSARVDLTSAAQWVDLFAVPTTAGAEAVIAMTGPAGALRFRVTVASAGTTLTGELIDAAGTATPAGPPVAFDPTAMHILQFRGSGGRVFLEYGSDLSAGMTALAPAGQAAAFPITSLDLEVFERLAEGAVLPGSYSSTYEGTY